MNDPRRKQLREALETLSAARAIVEQCRDDESEAAESIEENFPGSERAERAEESASRLDDAVTAFDEIEAAIDEAID